jgi:hypothetical protein
MFGFPHEIVDVLDFLLNYLVVPVQPTIDKCSPFLHNFWQQLPKLLKHCFCLFNQSTLYGCQVDLEDAQPDAEGDALVEESQVGGDELEEPLHRFGGVEEVGAFEEGEVGLLELPIHIEGFS